MPLRRAFEWHSFWPFFLLGKGVQHSSDFAEFLARGRRCRESTHYQATGGTAEGPLQEVGRDLLLGLLLRRACLVNVRSEPLAADEQALFGHQLNCLQRGGVTVVFAEFIVDFPHSCHSQPPNDGKNIEFGVGWKCHRWLVGTGGSHLNQRYYEKKRIATRKTVCTAA